MKRITVFLLVSIALLACDKNEKLLLRAYPGIVIAKHSPQDEPMGDYLDSQTGIRFMITLSKTPSSSMNDRKTQHVWSHGESNSHYNFNSFIGDGLTLGVYLVTAPNPSDEKMKEVELTAERLEKEIKKEMK